MNQFEFYLTLLGLLMGLSLVEIVGGAVRTAHARGEVRIGLLTPLLALFLMLDVTSYWENAWHFRDSIRVGFFSLYLGLFVSALYYYLASLVFPARIEENRDFDVYFMRVRRPILLGLALVNLPIIVLNSLTYEQRGHAGVTWYGTQLIYFALLIGPAYARSRPLIIAMLAANCVGYALWAIVDGLNGIDFTLGREGNRWMVAGMTIATLAAVFLWARLREASYRASAEIDPTRDDRGA